GTGHHDVIAPNSSTRLGQRSSPVDPHRSPRGGTMTSPGDSTASGPTATGLPANVAGALAYVLGPITGILFYVLEKDNRFIRFHAAQSIAVSVLMIILSIVLGILGSVLAFIPLIGW